MQQNNFDFIPDNKFDFQPEVTNNRFDFQEEEIPPTVEQTPVLKGKVEYNQPYDAIQNNTSLTPEQKVQQIKEISNNEREKIEREHKTKMAKLYGGAALEIGSAAIPFGGAGRIGGQVAVKLAKPAFSEISKRVIAKNIGSGTASGLASGTMFGIGEGLMQDKDIKGIGEEAIKGMGEGALGGGLVGGIAGKIAANFGRTKDIALKANRRKPVSQAKIEDAVRTLINTRRANIDSAKFDATQKINNLISQIDDISKELKVNPKNLREVLTFLRENKGLPTKNLNRPDLQNLFENLSFEQRLKLKDLAQKHFEEMEVFWNNLANIKNIKSNIDTNSYITHIWNMDNNSNQILQNYLRTKSPFERRRIIPTYREGIEKGLYIPIEQDVFKHIDLVPKTLDYAEIQKIHADQLIDSAENTKFLDEIKKLVKANPQHSKKIYELSDIVLNPVKQEKATDTFINKLFKKSVMLMI